MKSVLSQLICDVSVVMVSYVGLQVSSLSKGHLPLRYKEIVEISWLASKKLSQTFGEILLIT
jgi:hypothetical protein